MSTSPKTPAARTGVAPARRPAAGMPGESRPPLVAPGASSSLRGTTGGGEAQTPGAGAGEVLAPAPGRALIAAAMSEAELDGHVRRIAADLGLMRFHVYDSRRSPAGFPDLVFAGRWVLFRELKTERGKVSEAQREWLHALGLAGADVGIWRPTDLLNGTVAKELAAVARAAWMGDRE